MDRCQYGVYARHFFLFLRQKNWVAIATNMYKKKKNLTMVELVGDIIAWQ